jgi:NAD(P)-dependent dehydrogenase (short-subunit alcohol dehydrogenase family)
VVAGVSHARPALGYNESCNPKERNAMSLHGKVAIVTGANREIGAAMAETLARAGAAVVVAHRGEADRAESVVARIRSAGGRAIAHEADLSDIEANRALVDRAVDAFGRVDIFAANAGITLWSPFLETTADTWNTLIDLNLQGSFFGAQAAARQMVAQGRSADGMGGQIVFSSSVAGVQATPNGAVYGLTKAALRHLARTLAAELGPHGITVNALGIGATVNQRNLADDPDYAERWAGVIPAGRAVQPQDVADALLFLASPAAAMINGHTLLIDGGWSGTSPGP